MSSIFKRGGRYYAQIQDIDGVWRQVATGQTDLDAAEKWVAAREREVAAEKRLGVTRGELTVTGYAAIWIDQRKALGHDWKKDHGHLENYILPRIGDMPIASVRTPHLAEMMMSIRTSPRIDGEDPPAPRTVHNIYSSACALFRDAKRAGKVEQSPCDLGDAELGPRVDSDPEWRIDAKFDHDEAAKLISDGRIPWDRRVAYAIEVLSGLRPGESAALRWSRYNPAARPLGQLVVAKAFASKRNITKGTKTESVRYVPVHPTLAAILAEWKLAGWALMMGRQPEPDDLIIPMPPADAKARTKRAENDPIRTYWYSGRRWTDDMEALGWRHRRHYDLRATFITLALDDGADPEIIERRVTHTKKTRSAFDGYVRSSAPQFAKACAEVAKLRISRLPDDALSAVVVQSAKTEASTSTSGLRRRVSNSLPLSEARVAWTGNQRDTGAEGGGDPPSDTNCTKPVVQSSCDVALALLRAST